MFYDILAVLWSGPCDMPGIIAGVCARCGIAAAPEAVDGHLWFLTEFGFVEAPHGDRTGNYRLTESGSGLLAAAAKSRESTDLVEI